MHLCKKIYVGGNFSRNKIFKFWTNEKLLVYVKLDYLCYFVKKDKAAFLIILGGAKLTMFMHANYTDLFIHHLYNTYI